MAYFFELDEESLSDCNGSFTPARLSCSSWIKENENANNNKFLIYLGPGQSEACQP